MQGDFCVTYCPILISCSVCVPPTQLLLYLHSFHFCFWEGGGGVFVLVGVVLVDSCGCLVSARNKYEHHVNSLAMNSGTQTLINMSIIIKPFDLYNKFIKILR